MSKDWIGAFVKYVHKLKSSKLPLKTQAGMLYICMYGSNGHNIKGGSNGHFNHADPTRGQRFFSMYGGKELLSMNF